MISRFNSQLTTKLRRRSPIVSGLVLLCLIGQTMLPGVADTVQALSTGNSEVAGCCVVDLSRAAASGCCCGPTAGEGCGCACGTKKSRPATIGHRKDKDSVESRTIQSKICGCGGKYRPGIINCIEPAVLPQIDGTLFRDTDRKLPETFCELPGNSLPPPTPPPELCA